MDPYHLHEGYSVTRRVEKWIRWIPPIIRTSNSIVKMTACRHIYNSSIIIVKYMTLRDDMLIVKNNSFFELRY